MAIYIIDAASHRHCVTQKSRGLCSIFDTRLAVLMANILGINDHL